jgi:2',3'-cyclic-nucleotide 2'-phosphodiesterase (5'-nucleotidase family)
MKRLLLALALVACQRTPTTISTDAQPSSATKVTISIVGTNDLHGHYLAKDGRGGLAVLGGYLKNLRAARAKDGGGVLLLDGGDAFQGTLESNLNEGAAVIRGYNELGYAAMALGNHEFDFGPAGPAATPRAADDDPRGALKARAAEARFPFLAANVVEGGLPARWPNVQPSTVVEVAGVKIGVVGITTQDTPHTTMAANFRGLSVSSAAEAITAEAKALRAAGAQVIIVTGHVGSRCRSFDKPEDSSTCDASGEAFEIARALAPGTIDVIVGGHTHAGVAHLVNGVAIIESFSYGSAFGRVDLTVQGGKVTGMKVHRPRDLCEKVAAGTERCDEKAPRSGPDVPAEYEGAAIVPDEKVAAALRPFVDQSSQQAAEALGVRTDAAFHRAYDEESALGNLVADLMRTVRPADVALTNGGGLRSDLPAGDLTYGHVFTAFPFDNRFATIKMTGAELRALLRQNLERKSGIFSVSGIHVQAACTKGGLDVQLIRDDGRAIADKDALAVVTSDFLATGGDGVTVRETAVTVDDGVIREVVVEHLRARKGSLRPADYLDRAKPRISYPGKRPVTCP